LGSWLNRHLTIMAESLAHRWGQIIGDVFEQFVRDVLNGTAEKHQLFLDYKKPRRARANQGGKDLSKVTWQDSYGNRHDLDYVLERGGTEDKLGVPVAFIESAWRRYTKHSKNKVQEIEAAILPIALTFSRHSPFCGAVLAGEFTSNALTQLEPKDFSVLHIPYKSILDAFREIGVDASSLDAITSEDEFRRKIEQWEKLPQPVTVERFLKTLYRLHAAEVAQFQARLEASLLRGVVSIRLAVLRGHAIEYSDVESAIVYLIEEEKAYRLREGAEQREMFEIVIRFNNAAKIEATFPTRQEAIAFLRTFE
jgi:hypothetical protein